jgi:hypothetical protein
MQQYKDEYYNGRERMNPTIENKIKDNTTDVSKNPAFPRTDKDGNPVNYIELLAYKRFLDVVKKVKHYTGLQDISGQNGFMRLQMKLQESIMQIFTIERQHRQYLEKLGVDLVTEEMELPSNAIKIDAKIVDMGTIEKDGFQTESKEPSQEQVKSQFEVEAQEMEMTPMQVFNLEKEKRRFINLLIQGASKKGHYMFEFRRTELNRLHPELANLYGIVMSINDLTYWVMPENMIEQMTKNPQAVAGKEEIEDEEETKVKTQAICFPVSVHENIKGVMEVFGTHGLPDSKEAQEMIFNSTDTLMNEVWDIRLGVVVWEKFLRNYPMEVFEEGKRYIQHFIFSRFCALDSDEFFKVSREILSDNPKGEKFIKDMVDDIVRDMKKRDLNDVFGDDDNEDYDYFRKGGNVSSIEKRVQEVNRLIELGNANNLEVVDSRSTWQSPMKYKPIKYSNGVLYIEYEDLDLYQYNRKGIAKWTTEKYKVLKRDMEFDNPLNDIARMYRKALREAGVQYGDGGMAGLSEVSPMLPNPLPMSTIQPMANGGEIKKLEKSLENAEKNYRKAILSEQVGIISPTELNRAKNKVDSLREKINDWYASRPIGKRMANGGDVSEEVGYINRRINNLQEMLSVVNEDEKQDIQETINELKRERDNLEKKNNSIEDVSPKKKFFGLFKKGGELKLPKNNSKVHFTDDRGNEFEGIFIEAEGGNVDMFLVGFGEGSSDFRFPMEVTDWHYLDDNNDEDAHAKHEASETAEEEREEHEYDVYDNKRMLKNQAVEVEHHSEELNNQVKLTKQVPAWVIAKMERATTDLSDITHYLDGENKMADGGSVDGDRYDVVPYGDKFVVVRVYTKKGSYSPKSGVIMREFNGQVMKFNDIQSAQNFIDNIKPKYPYGIPKANAGMVMLASQLLQQQQQQQQQQPQVVYYVPQPQVESQNTGIVQNIPQMAFGGETSDLNDFCITQIIGLANDLQPVKYYSTIRYDDTDFESKNYKGKVVIVFKEPVKVAVVNAINEFVEKAEDCHDIFEQSANTYANEPNSISVYLLTDNFTDTEFKKGGKVYEYSPKKINLSKTKKITTQLGDYILGLVTNDFVYFVNSNEGDENAQTIMYNKKGELLSDNIHATNDLFETLETQDSFEFIHPDMEAYRQEIINGN